MAQSEVSMVSDAFGEDDRLVDGSDGGPRGHQHDASLAYAPLGSLVVG